MCENVFNCDCQNFWMYEAQNLAVIYKNNKLIMNGPNGPKTSKSACV